MQSIEYFEKNNTSNSIVFYPNPVKDYLYFVSSIHPESIKIYDVAGKLQMVYYPDKMRQ